VFSLAFEFLRSVAVSNPIPMHRDRLDRSKQVLSQLSEELDQKGTGRHYLFTA